MTCGSFPNGIEVFADLVKAQTGEGGVCNVPSIALACSGCYRGSISVLGSQGDYLDVQVKWQAQGAC